MKLRASGGVVHVSATSRAVPCCRQPFPASHLVVFSDDLGVNAGGSKNVGADGDGTS